ncbi:MAG: hypothetical protein JSV05_00035 [Candidatus Bathyarchaeota archaeon]|nr:MAG: hypothetical protein JSV05_00035 [Candidatus Bathyarchaeota archaeon]
MISKHFALLPVLFLVPLIAAGFSIDLTTHGDLADRGDTITEAGTITFLGFEGGFYGIISDDGKHYDPINLDERFQVDGLRVQFELKILEGYLGIHMWGAIVQIISMEVLQG